MTGRKTMLAVACIFGMYGLVWGQQSWKTFSAEKIFLEARKTVEDHHLDPAREMLLYALEQNPAYHDARVLLGRTYAWDKNYDLARKELQKVINNEPHHQDALLALLDVEIWDHQYSEALTLIEFLDESIKSSDDVQYKKALALHRTSHDDEAMAVLGKILNANPAHQAASDLLNLIRSEKLRYMAGLFYNVDFFSRTFDPAQYASAQLTRVGAWGSAVLKLNYAQRFTFNGFQPELDLYPKIANGVYAYLNYGYSESELFPTHRVGAEIFSRLGKKAEISAGIRHLSFDADSKATIITGTIGYYAGNYWISLRPFVTPDDKAGTTVSGTLQARRYFQDRDNYVGINLGGGFTPDERRLQTAAGLTSDGIYVLASQRAGIIWSKTLPHHFIFVGNLDLTRQELIFDEGEYVFITGAGVALKKRF